MPRRSYTRVLATVLMPFVLILGACFPVHDARSAARDATRDAVRDRVVGDAEPTPITPGAFGVGFVLVNASTAGRTTTAEAQARFFTMDSEPAEDPGDRWEDLDDACLVTDARPFVPPDLLDTAFEEAGAEIVHLSAGARGELRQDDATVLTLDEIREDGVIRYAGRTGAAPAPSQAATVRFPGSDFPSVNDAPVPFVAAPTDLAPVTGVTPGTAFSWSNAGAPRDATLVVTISGSENVWLTCHTDLADGILTVPDAVADDLPPGWSGRVESVAASRTNLSWLRGGFLIVAASHEVAVR
ncbi:MAG: hypothetical protein WD336_03085 [Trueperaceae bacterium]